VLGLPTAIIQSSLARSPDFDDLVIAPFGAQVFHLKRETFQRALLRGLGTWELDAKLDLEGMGNCLNIQAETGAIPPTLALSSMVQSL
jgi:hypothetical protein